MGAGREVIAALPMYDRPENAAAHDRLWAAVRDGLRARGVAAPDALDRGLSPAEGWARPDLVLGQICNLPWRALFRGRVTIVAAADHAVEGCAPGFYRSVIVARADDPAPGDRFALNEPLSNSGWDMPQAWARAEGRPLRPVLATGSHRASALAVAEGRADLAGIDAVTWSLLCRWEGWTARLRVLALTEPSPGMTFVCAPGHDPAPLRAALESAIGDLSAEDRAALGELRGLADLPPSAYDHPLPPPPDLPAVASAADLPSAGPASRESA